MISGMTCGGCVRSVERKLAAVPGVARVKVDLAGGLTVVEGTAPAEALADAIKGKGYGVRLVS
jgi:copper chaperone CopZ